LNRGDVDSLLFCARTPEPFVCDSGGFTVNLKPEKVSRCANRKLTAYLNIRRSIAKVRAPRYRARGERMDENELWYEFPLGSFGYYQLYVLFQIDSTAGVLRGAPRYSTVRDHGRLVIVRNAFLRNIVVRAARRMPIKSVTAMSGLPWVSDDLDGTYQIASVEWNSFAANMGQIMTEESIRRTCGMGYVRFYTCQHGIREPRLTAMSVVRGIIDIDHPHVDVVQVHVADELTFDNGDVAMVQLVSDNRESSLRAALDGPVDYGTCIVKYSAAFLSAYGYFNKYTSLPNDADVTFVQAYNAAAKMYRPENMSLLAVVYMCGIFRDVTRKDKAIRRAVNVALQHARNAACYADNYVRKVNVLRLEQVNTFDRQTARIAIHLSGIRRARHLRR